MLLGARHRTSALFALAFLLVVTACATSSSETGTAGNSSPKGTDGAGSSTTNTGGSVSAGDVPIVTAPDQPDVQHLKFKYGPIKIEPGQNNITVSNLQVPKPAVDGFIVGIHPNLYRDDGS